MFKTKILLLFLVALFLAIPAVSLAQTSQSSSNFDYQIMEGIPGIIQAGAKPDFNQYVSGVYSFALWAVGIAALLMLSIGAFMYLTSAGNNAAMGSAKGVITDAIIGLILALVAWLMLNIINPDLVKPKGITGVPISPTAITAPAGGVLSPSYVMQRLSTAEAINTDGTINYSKAIGDTGLSASPLCNNYNFTNTSGVDPAMLKTIAHLESGGCSNPSATSSAGACGLMQLKPSTASTVYGSTVTCDMLKNDPSLSIQIAAKYIAQNMKSSGVLASKNQDSAILAGYNSGYGTVAGTSVSGKNPALAPSVDCPGARAFECSKNPGGLVESIRYAYNGTGLYALYKKQ